MSIQNNDTAVRGSTAVRVGQVWSYMFDDNRTALVIVTGIKHVDRWERGNESSYDQVSAWVMTGFDVGAYHSEYVAPAHEMIAGWTVDRVGEWRLVSDV